MGFAEKSASAQNLSHFITVWARSLDTVQRAIQYIRQFSLHEKQDAASRLEKTLQFSTLYIDTVNFLHMKSRMQLPC